MHGEHSSSQGPKVALSAIHLGILVWAAWLLFGGGTATVLAPFGLGPSEAQPARRALLLAAGLVYWFRMTFGLFAFLRRRMDWSEIAIVAPWLFVIHTTFALLGATNSAPLGLQLSLGIPLYLLGSIINTGSELQRHRWKREREHAGHLYIEGLFRYARHINYFGDIVLFTGYALATGRIAALAIPVIMTLGFFFEHVPKLDRYLEARYGDEYRDWVAHTPRLVPWLY
jgi:protein-S-isoprenylcysteine O-methyltransferase Ste14